MRDRRLVYAATFLRSLATGAAGILFGIHLGRLGLDPTAVGLVLAAGLVGNLVAGVLTTAYADRAGRRRSLAALGVLGGVGGAAFALASTPWALGAAAAFGLLNGMGRDRGASVILEQAMLPQTGRTDERTRTFGFYNVAGDVGHALGGALAALPELLREGVPRLGIPASGLDSVSSVRLVLLVCAALAVLTVPLSLALSAALERPAPAPGPAAPEASAGLASLSPESRRLLVRLSGLFAIDALGGGFLSTAWLAWHFQETFHVGEGWIGLLFVGARIANAGSHMGAVWIAKRIGLVKTMVFTHLPSSLFLLTVIGAPTFPIAAVLFLLREGLSQMDVPTRQSFVMAVVRPEDRVVVSGTTQLVRLGAWAVAPSFAGWLALALVEGAPIAVGATLKILYDLLLWREFRLMKVPDEVA